MSWKPEVEVSGVWYANALVFATEAEADNSAHELMSRWLVTTGARAVKSDLPVNYRFVAGRNAAIEPVAEPRTAAGSLD
jgi:hypothetical protein